jgi:hypothetical protein
MKLIFNTQIDGIVDYTGPNTENYMVYDYVYSPVRDLIRGEINFPLMSAVEHKHEYTHETNA